MFICDNAGYSHVPQIMHFLCCLFFIPAYFKITLWAVHVPGLQKQPSRRDLPQSLALYFSQLPEAVSNPARRAHPPGGTSAGLDLPNLDTIVQQLFSAVLAPSTLKLYRSGKMQFLHFCDQYKLSPPFPVTEKMLVFFVAFLHKDGLSSRTIKSFLAAVRHTEIGPGGPPLK